MNREDSIQIRIEHSLKTDAVNGNAFQRRIVRAQLIEAHRVIDNLKRRIVDIQESNNLMDNVLAEADQTLAVRIKSLVDKSVNIAQTLLICCELMTPEQYIKFAKIRKERGL